MLGADVLRCGAQSGLAYWLLTGRPPLWGFLVLEFTVGIGTAFFTPAMTGLIPQVSDPRHPPPGQRVRMAPLSGVAP